MEEEQIQAEVKCYVGDANIYEAFDTLNNTVDGQVTFVEFVSWAFTKNMAIELEKEKERNAKLEFTKGQEVES